MDTKDCSCVHVARLHPLSCKSLQHASHKPPSPSVQDSGCCLDDPRFISPASDGGQPVQVYTIHGEEELCEDGRGSRSHRVSILHRCSSTFLKFVDMTVWCIIQHPFPCVVSSCHNLHLLPVCSGKTGGIVCLEGQDS